MSSDILEEKSEKWNKSEAKWRKSNLYLVILCYAENARIQIKKKYE